MNNFTKGMIVFTGGVISGLGIGVSYVTYLGLKNEKIHKAIVDTVADKIVGLLYGDDEYKPRPREGYVSYRRYSRDRDKQTHRPFTCDIFFDTLDDLNQVLDSFRKIMEMYGRASAADLYELCGCPYDYLDAGIGWTSIDDFKISENKDTFMLKCPEPVEL